MTQRTQIWLSLGITAVLMLALLLFTGASPRPPYIRADWGRWRADACRDTRTRVLVRDARAKTNENNAPGYLWRDGGCELAWGRWTSFYTPKGAIITNPLHLQIDHVLALNEVHEAGGWRWSKEKKNAFYNWPYNLVTASVADNQAKKAKGMPEWLPPDSATHCRYAEIRGTTRAAWGLSAPREAEQKALRAALAQCPAAILP